MSVHCYKSVHILTWPQMLPGRKTPTTNKTSTYHMSSWPCFLASGNLEIYVNWLQALPVKWPYYRPPPHTVPTHTHTHTLSPPTHRPDQTSQRAWAQGHGYWPFYPQSTTTWMRTQHEWAFRHIPSFNCKPSPELELGPSQTKDLQNWYSSLCSHALGIIRIGQGLVGSVSG